MRFIAQATRRTFYACEEDGEFILSAVPAAVAGRRPVARFDTREELEAAIAARQGIVEWQTPG